MQKSCISAAASNEQREVTRDFFLTKISGAVCSSHSSTHRHKACLDFLPMAELKVGTVYRSRSSRFESTVVVVVVAVAVTVEVVVAVVIVVVAVTVEVVVAVVVVVGGAVVVTATSCKLNLFPQRTMPMTDSVSHFASTHEALITCYCRKQLFTTCHSQISKFDEDSSNLHCLFSPLQASGEGNARSLIR